MAVINVISLVHEGHGLDDDGHGLNDDGHGLNDDGHGLDDDGHGLNDDGLQNLNRSLNCFAGLFLYERPLKQIQNS